MAEQTQSFEKLGLFYLGKERGIDGAAVEGMPFLYKSKNLTTHGVIIGMTGSGKTGLGIGLIEEAIMDDIPSIIIDPKGDMANLLLSFPELRPSDFEPWVDPAEASRKNMTVSDFAADTASTWRDGLAQWGQGPERIAAMREKTEMTVYTPGSGSGVGVSILSGFDAPDEAMLSDVDGLNALVGSTATSLLALIGIDGDPLTSREHILISSILLYSWRQGENLSLEALIGAIVNPPFETVGVFGLASFFPQPERMKLAMLLNNVIASPSFSSWLQGEPLDIGRMLYGEDGRPRTAIFSIAHLGEKERMFFVTMLLNRFIGWMRRQQGSSSLKAVLYMDEIFGYFPPLGNPPAKKPMLLLLKQARAYGIGVVLATQNPVDLDYKGLSNIGSWFVGRLQTTQDQNRVIDGIVGASDGVLDRAAARALLGDMKGRNFLLSSSHLDEPVLFETRWVMSYLKGPIALPDIARLMAGREAAQPALHEPLSRAGERSDGRQDHPPLISDRIEQRFFMPPVLTEKPVFEPWLAARASVRFYNAKRNIDVVNQHSIRLYLDESFTDPKWEEGEPMNIAAADCIAESPAAGSFYRLPDTILSLRDLNGYQKDYADYLYQNERLELLRAPDLKLESDPGESEAEFRVRIGDFLREQKEAAAEKLLDSFRQQRERLEAKKEQALVKIEKEEGDVKAKMIDTGISFGTAILGAIFGRKTFSTTTISRGARAVRTYGRVSEEKEDVRLAQEAAERVVEDIAELEHEQAKAIDELGQTYDPAAVEIETFAIKPRRSDIFEVDLQILWEMVTRPNG